MVRYFKAGTNTIGLPKEMVFFDKSQHPHLFPSLTPKHHLASHYGQSAIQTAYNPKGGNLLKITRGEYTDYAKKVKKVKKAAKALADATTGVENAAKKMRKPRRKPGAKMIDDIVASAIGAATTIPNRRGRARLSPEVKAAREQAKIDLKAQKKFDREMKKAEIETLKLENAIKREELAIARKLKKKTQ